jgi:hypothetical protein
MYAVDSQAGTTNFTLLFYKPVKRVKYSPDNKYIAGVDDTGHFCIIDNPRGATPIIKYDNNTSATVWILPVRNQAFIMSPSLQMMAG